MNQNYMETVEVVNNTIVEAVLENETKDIEATEDLILLADENLEDFTPKEHIVEQSDLLRKLFLNKKK